MIRLHQLLTSLLLIYKKGCILVKYLLFINLRMLVASNFTCLTIPFIRGKKGNKKEEKRKECTLLTKTVLLQMTWTLHSFLISSKASKSRKILLWVSNEITDNEDEKLSLSSREQFWSSFIQQKVWALPWDPTHSYLHFSFLKVQWYSNPQLPCIRLLPYHCSQQSRFTEWGWHP